jgi:6-phosphogluconate dehydrogenase
MLGLASAEYDYGIDLAEVARIWKGGCIVRSRILDVLRRAYRAEPKLAHPFLSPVYRRALAPVAGNLRTLVSAASAAAIPVPSLGATVAYLDGMGRARLPANLIQAQRDHFGAHTYERIDRPGVFHTRWD